MNICFFDDNLEKIQKENPVSYALCYLPFLSYFPVIDRESKYYYKLILQDYGSCTFSHKFRGDDYCPHQIPYNYESYKSSIANSKTIITKVTSYKEYENTNATRRISSVVPL